MNEIILEGCARFVAFTTDAREMAIIYWRAKRMQPLVTLLVYLSIWETGEGEWGGEGQQHRE